MVSYELDLNLTPGDVLPRLNVSQYNKGQTVECIIYHGSQMYSIPSGATALVNGTKPDKTGFEYNATVSGGEVLFTITEQMTAVAGDVTCEVVILKDGERVGTINFLLVVEAAALSDDTVISETDLPIIQRIPEFVAECEAAAYLAEEWAIGPGSTGAEPSATNNAYYWAMQAASAAGAGFTPTVVQELPTTDISIHTIYFVPSADPSASNYYDEYINLDGTTSGWELVGTTAIDLTGYYTKTEVDTLLGGKQDTLTFDNAPTANSSNPVKSGGVYTALDAKQPKTMSQAIAGQTTVEGCLSQLNTDFTAFIGSLGDAIWGTNNVPSGQSTSIGTRPGFFTYTLPKGKYILIGSLRQDTNLVIYRDVNGMTVTSGTAHVDVLNIDAIRHSEEGLICLAIATITSNSATIMDNAYYCPDGGNIVCNTNCVAIRLK